METGDPLPMGSGMMRDAAVPAAVAVPLVKWCRGDYGAQTAF